MRQLIEQKARASVDAQRNTSAQLANAPLGHWAQGTHAPFDLDRRASRNKYMAAESKLHPRRGRTGASGLGAAKSVALLLGLVALLYVSVEATGGRRLLQDKVGSVMGVDLGAAFSSIGLSMSTTAAGLEIKEYCKKVHSSELAWFFRNQTVDVPFYTACPSASWVDRFHQLGKDKPLTMVDIGCNKGYSSAHAFGLWAPELGFAPNTLRTKRPEVGCGTCNDCAEEVGGDMGVLHTVSVARGPGTIRPPPAYDGAFLHGRCTGVRE